MFLKTISRFNISRVLKGVNRIPLSKRCLHVSTVSNEKKFVNFETEFVYKFVQNYDQEKIECKQTFQNFKFNEDLTGKTTAELVEAFEALSHHCANTQTEISCDDYDKFVNQFVKEIAKFKDEEIMKVLSDMPRFSQTKGTSSKNFQPLWETLDEVCCSRMINWKLPTLLKVSNLWYKNHLAKLGRFTGNALIKMCRRIRQFTAKELVEAMFYLTVCRRKINMIDVEKRFLSVFDQLDINEIGIICLAFFKTESKMHNRELIEKIYDRTTQDIEIIEDITIVNIMKSLRYSSEPTHVPKMPALCNAMLPRIPSFNLLACLHIALLGTNLQYCHNELLEMILKKYDEKLKEARLKDIERIAFIMGLFDIKTKSGVEKSLLKKINEELKIRIQEIMRHPKCLASTAHYLSVCGVYDPELISSALNEEFVKYAYGNNHMKIGREIICLDSYARINLKSSYKGILLPDKMRKSISKFSTAYVPYRGQPYKLTHADNLMLDMKEFYEEKFGANTLTHILPHFQRPDIVFCLDGDGKPVTEKILEHFPPLYQGNIISKEFLFSKDPQLSDKMEKYHMIAVVVGGWNFFIRDTSTPTGILRMKLEQLEMVGYKPILIHFNTWTNGNINDRHAFIEKEIKRLLN